ncbi:UNVERIFIED_CONTAM: hypothetical protein HDU68_004616, partial [Siphonaria sp. JEL0065]
MPTPTENEDLVLSKKPRVDNIDPDLYAQTNELAGYWMPSGTSAFEFTATKSNKQPGVFGNVEATTNGMGNFVPFEFRHHSVTPATLLSSALSPPVHAFSTASSRGGSPFLGTSESRSNSPSIELRENKDTDLAKAMEAKPDRSAHLAFKGLASQLDVTSRATIAMHLNKIKKMQSLEDKFVVLPTILRDCPELNKPTLMICCQWLSESCAKKGFGRSTYHLAVSNLFAYLKKHKNVRLEDFQMVGAAMLHRATKVEECDDFGFSVILAPTDEEQIESNEESEADLEKSSNDMKSFEDSLLFGTSAPVRIVTAYDWLMVYRQNHGYFCKLTESLTHPVDFDYYGDAATAEYMFQVLDLMVTDVDFLGFQRSLLAAGVWYYFNTDVKNTTLLMVTGYTLSQLDLVTSEVQRFIDGWGIPVCADVCPQWYYHRQSLSFVPLDDL